MESATVTLTSHAVGSAAPAFPADVPPELARRFRESADWFTHGGAIPPGVPYVSLDDTPGAPAGLWRGATGAIGDRKAGKDLPRFWSEIDLRGYRVMSRWLWETNPFMIGFGNRLTDYHVGKGYQWQACRKGQEKQPYATGRSGDDLLKKVQTILDEWRDSVAWPLRSREGFKRLHRDGAVIQRFGCGERGCLPWVRWINPEQVGSPTGDTNTEDSFGVRTREGDTEHVTAVFVRDHDGDGQAGEWVNADKNDPAARVLYFKTNTDSDVKVGLPDSFSVHDSIDEARKCVRNMTVVATAQAAVAWLEKYPTATAEQVRALIPTGFPQLASPAFGTSTGETVYSEKLAAGTVLRTEGSREFAPGPTSASVGNYVEAVQAALRMACVRWGMPPYMTAKADDINFASSLTAGSPFAVAVEGGQVEWGTVEKATAAKVLDLAVESGRLTWAERRQIDVEVVPPSVTSPDKGADTDRLLGLLREKVVDPYTVQQELGYDPSHVEANWDAWEKRRAAGVGADDSLRGSLASVSAVMQLQTAVAGGQLTAEAAVANLHLVFGIDPADAAKLFPPKPPTDLTPDGEGPDQMGAPSPFGEAAYAARLASGEWVTEARDGLVAKKVSVNRGGKTVQTTVYVNPQARGTVNDRGEQDIGPKAIDHPANLKGGVNTHGHPPAMKGPPELGPALEAFAAAPEGSPVRAAIDNAVANASPGTDHDASNPPAALDPERVRRFRFDLAAQHAEMADAGMLAPADDAAFVKVMGELGIEPLHEPGETKPFDPETMEADFGVSTGAPVRVARRGWVGLYGDPGTGLQLRGKNWRRAKVEPDAPGRAESVAVSDGTFAALVESGAWLAPEIDDAGRVVEAGAGLVAKKVTVQRSTGPVQTTVWVKPDQAGADPGPKATAGGDGPTEPRGTPSDPAPHAAAKDYADNGVRAKSFKEWFGDFEADPANASKVVNPATGEPTATHGTGKPVKVFHGTTAEFDSFDVSKAGTNAAHVGPGFYFAEDPEVAKTFTGSDRSGKIIEAYLNVRRPYDFDSTPTADDHGAWGDAIQAINPKAKKSDFLKEVASRADYEERDLTAFEVWKVASAMVGRDGANKVVASMGYDGITHQSIDSGGTPKFDPTGKPAQFGRVWIAFEPHQIKAVNNRGTFDRDSPKIHESLESRVREGFTGTFKDKAGHERHYVDGKQVAAPESPGEQKDEPPKADAPGTATGGTRAKADPTDWQTPDWQHAPTGKSQGRYVNRYTGKVVYAKAPPKGRTEAERKAAVEERAERLKQPAQVAASHEKAAGEAGAAVGLPAEAFPALMGGQPGTVARVSKGIYGASAYVSLDHPDTTTWSRTVSAQADGSVEVYNAMFFLRPNAQGDGFGTKAFAGQIAAAVEHGVARVKTTAGRGTLDGVPMNGYATWPRLGYDAPLTDGQRKRLPKELRGAKTVLDLYDSKEGRDWWKEHGETTSMTFDVSPGSKSMKVLNAYLESKGQPVIDYTPEQAKTNADRQAGRVAATRKKGEAEVARLRQATTDAVHDRGATAATRAGHDPAEIRRAAEANVARVYDPQGTIPPGEKLSLAYSLTLNEAGAARFADRVGGAGRPVQARYHGYAQQFNMDPADVDREAASVARLDSGILDDADAGRAVRTAYMRAFDRLRERNRSAASESAGGGVWVNEAGREGLVKKTITDKNGVRRTVLVKPGDAGPAAKPGAKPATAAQDTGMTTDEKRAVANYKNAAHAGINRGLRSGRLDPRDTAAVAQIDAALAKSPLPSPIVVHRGYGDSDLLSDNGFPTDPKPGDTFTDPGYSSTTTDPEKARKWAPRPHDVTAEIRVPAGVGAVHTDALVTNQAPEGEVLLPRGLAYRVVSRTPKPGGTGYHLVLEVRPPG